jgi:hypothetical protein
MRVLASALTVLLLAVPALGETSVGVTAAVNPSATGTVGSAIRTISLGDNVVYSERIQTGGEGLVQILLADGTTFMVGPNSDLVIDSFVYDPNAGTAAVTATFTKGVLRFIGGQASKNGGNVTLNTPVGTMGIRGAMVDVVLDPPAGTPPHIDMLFGNEVTLEQGQALLGRLYAAGYSLVLGTGGQFDIMKTPPGWGSQVQQALAGKIGTRGGAIVGPSDGEVETSKVAENNSNNGRGQDGLTREERDALLQAAAQYDQLRDFLLNNQNLQGFIGGEFTGVYEEDEEDKYLNLAALGDYVVTISENMYDPIALDPVFAEFAFDAEGNPIRIRATFLSLFDNMVYEGDGTTGTITYDDAEGGPATPITTSGDTLVSYENLGVENPDLALQLANELGCVDCDEFVRWGFWGFSAAGMPVGEEIADVDFQGTWIIGDMTTAPQLAGLAGSNATATYHGDMVGNVHNAYGPNESSVDYENGVNYVATGDLVMTWDFAARTGNAYVNNFDTSRNYGYGLNFSYDLSTPGEGESTAFQGGLVTTDPKFGTVTGAFANNGADAAAGVIGNFMYGEYLSFSDPFPAYSVGGVFFGSQTTP